MFEKLVAAIQALANELKRYNDRKDLTSPIEEPKAEAPKAAAKPAAAPAAPVATAKPAAKPAAKAKTETKEVTFLETQTAAGKYIAKQLGGDLEKFVKILKDNGVPSVEENGKTRYKLSTVKEDVETLTVLHSIFTGDAPEAEEDPTA